MRAESRRTQSLALATLLLAVNAVHAVCGPAPGDSPASDSPARPKRIPILVAHAPNDSGPRPVRIRMALPPVEADGDSARVSGKLVQGLIVVPVSINGAGPFWLGIDTGAMGHLRLDDAVAERLALPVQGRTLASDPSRRNPREVKLYRVDSLAIGSMRIRGAVATGVADSSTRRLRGVDGILGIDLFSDLPLTLDYPKAELRLGRAALPPANGTDIVAFERERGPIRVTLQAGDRQLACDLDTGNLIAPFVFPTEFALSLPRKGEPRTGGIARTASQQMEIRLVTLDVPLRLGSFEFPSAEVAFPALHEAGNIGAKALARFTIEIDQRNKRIRLARPS